MQAIEACNKKRTLVPFLEYTAIFVNKKIVIVGAGMAGLSAASYLARENLSVLLLDKNDRTGGLINTFSYDGFFFDGGPRAFVNSGIVQPILRDLGISCDFLENRISIGVEDQLFRVESMDSIVAYKRMLVSMYPENVEDIETITSIIRELSEYTRILYEFDNPNFVDLKSNKKFIINPLDNQISQCIKKVQSVQYAHGGVPSWADR